MTASFGGHVDTVRILIEAKAEVNIQNKVLCLYVYCTVCSVQHLYRSAMYSMSVCGCVRRMAGLLSTWQLMKANLMW